MEKESLDFTFKRINPILKIGMVVIFEGIRGTITKLEGITQGLEFCVVELKEPDRFGCKIIELRKSIFNISVYPSQKSPL